MIAEKTRKEEEITDIEEELRDIEADNIIMDDNIRDLNEENKRFLKIKYGEKKKDWQIGFKLGIPQSSAARIRQGLVENVAGWEQWYKNMH